MKTMNDEKTNITSTFTGEVQDFQADPKAIMLLIDKIYSNKIQVITQEYMSNARDAHREYKTIKGRDQTKRIKVKLPSKLSLSWSVRDYGIGIDDNRMREVFTFIGRSTKRQNNKQTGGFGIGAKTGWAYKNAFIVRTYLDGVLKEYSAVKDVNHNAKLQLLNECATNEENGTEIEIAVDEKDIDNFVNNSIRASYFWNENERPEFINLNSMEKNVFYTEDCEIKKFNSAIILKADLLPSHVKPSYNHFLIIDGIPYPTNNAINSKLTNELSEIKKYLSAAFVLSVKTGNLEVSATRESIEDDIDGKNVSILRILYLDLVKELQKNIEYEKSKALTANGLTDVINNASKIMKDNWLQQIFPIKYKNYVLKTVSDRYTLNTLALYIDDLKKPTEKTRYSPVNIEGINCTVDEYTISKDKLKKTAATLKGNGFYLSNIAIVLMDCSEIKPVEKNKRIRSLFSSNIKTVYLISDYQGSGFVSGLTDEYFTKLSEIKYDASLFVKSKPEKIEKTEEEKKRFYYYNKNRDEDYISDLNDIEEFDNDVVYCLYSEYKNKDKEAWFDYVKMLPDNVQFMLITKDEERKIKNNKRFTYYLKYSLTIKRAVVLYNAVMEYYNDLKKLFAFDYSQIQHLELNEIKEFRDHMNQIETLYPQTREFLNLKREDSNNYKMGSYKYLTMIRNSNEYHEISLEFKKIGLLRDKLEKNEYCTLMSKMLNAGINSDIVYEFINYKINKEIK